MKTTSIVRKTDGLGRIVLPAELRKTLGIGENDSLEIFTDEDRIVLRKYKPGCVFCGGVGNVKRFNGIPVCADCAKMIANSDHTKER